MCLFRRCKMNLSSKEYEDGEEDNHVFTCIDLYINYGSFTLTRM